jgi:two-component system chemotaxis response regulator CheY
MKFLIVEDDPSGIMLLKTILAGYGDVDEVIDGTAAVEAFDNAWAQGKPYDVIFLDIMMPGMNGHDVLLAIRERERERRLPQVKEVKVIMTTALDNAESVSQAFLKGRASAYLVKPILRAKVLEEMRKLGIF